MTNCQHPASKKIEILNAAGKEPADYVEPFLGTEDCRWLVFTPAALPFGMVKLAPQTYGYGGYKGGGNITGYDYRHNSIIGFSHLHEFQLGAVLVMPTTGPVKTIPGTEQNPDQGFRSRFCKETEIAQAGYYSVKLHDYEIRAELTATTRVGFHRYTFPETKSAHILLDIGHNLGESGLVSQPVKDASVRVVNKQVIEGFVILEPQYVGRAVTVYFTAQFNKSFGSYGTFREETTYPGEDKITGPGVGIYVDYSTANGEIIEVKVGISFVSIEQARINLDVEAASLSFEQARTRARQIWNEELGRIEVQGSNEEDKIKFYTGLWHVLLGKGISSDVNGKYIGFNNQAGQIPLKDRVPEYAHYNCDGLWCACWNLNQIWSLVYPEHTNSFIRCLLDVYDSSGWIPDGIVCDKYSPGIPTNHTSPLIACAYNKGIRGFDVNKAYRAIYKNQTEFIDRPEGAGNQNLDAYLKYGYVPSEEKGYGPPGHTLEYAYADWCLSQIAKALGKNEDYAFFIKRAKSYEKLFDPDTKFMRPRKRDGSFIEPFDPMSGGGFAEGNSWQYTWFVPHDIHGLIELMGKDTFNYRINYALEKSSHAEFSGHGNTGGYGAIYNQGNEPDLQVPYLFNYSGKPWLTQKWVREIMDCFYGVTPEKGYGYGQDDDQGQLGSWFVLGAIGLFDVQGGAALKPVYQISSPIFDKIVIHLDRRYYEGDKFVIETKNNSKQNIYIPWNYWNILPLNCLPMPAPIPDPVMLTCAVVCIRF